MLLNKDRDKYFLDSVDKICAFLETNADEVFKSDGDHSKVFNKVGHALHVLNPKFKQVTFGKNVKVSRRRIAFLLRTWYTTRVFAKNLFKSVGYVDPIVCQSMYIFKQPRIGDKVTPHQDGSYLHTVPLKIIGVWIALEDCTVQNGCLQFIPGSQKC